MFIAFLPYAFPPHVTDSNYDNIIKTHFFFLFHITGETHKLYTLSLQLQKR